MPVITLKSGKKPFGTNIVIHTPVLLQEVIDYLSPTPGKKFIDATIGGGGHTIEILNRGGQVLGIDRDPEAIESIKIDHDLVLVNDNFSNIGSIAKANGFTSVDGILFDLGLSSLQLDNLARGFSFQSPGPLDMRMDPNLAIKAQDIINNFDERQLYEIFKTFAQEKYSRAIAGAICRARRLKPVEDTGDLANIIEEISTKSSKIKIKARIFQALRIIVNSELLNLKDALPQTEKLLKSGGRLAVISFHSLEDGLVKRFFKGGQWKVLTKKPIGPGPEEIITNPRARSARLRVGQKQ